MISTHYMAVAAGIMAAAAAIPSGYSAVNAITAKPLVTGWAIYESPVSAGGVVSIPWAISKRTTCPGLSSRAWAGENGFTLSEPMRATALPKGDGVYQVQTAIPELAVNGPLSLSIVGFFDCPNEPRQHFTLGPVELTVDNEVIE